MPMWLLFVIVGYFYLSFIVQKVGELDWLSILTGATNSPLNNPWIFVFINSRLGRPKRKLRKLFGLPKRDRGLGCFPPARLFHADQSHPVRPLLPNRRTKSNDPGRVPEEYHDILFSRFLREYFGETQNAFSQIKSREQQLYFRNLLSKRALQELNMDHKDFKDFLKRKDIRYVPV